MMRNFFPIALCFAIVAAFASCKHDIQDPDVFAPPCDLESVTFSVIVAPIIDTKCAGCHDADSPSAGLSLVTYDQIAAIANDGSLLSSLRGTDGFSLMPDGGPALNSCAIDQIEAWINNGAPND